ncbi:hypothetical protein BT63DRAFT_185424 [Microthyrium microscopicum]|uniref:Uncharacterized protein n=1 Tax=Microthyrium microscopicum TaxID=703497 RepID=A0A6A6UM52_9PEZI|nr:hypothetical protein BT63DRAFT_185424 [Microthyrium microscopicum]
MADKALDSRSSCTGAIALAGSAPSILPTPWKAGLPRLQRLHVALFIFNPMVNVVSSCQRNSHRHHHCVDREFHFLLQSKPHDTIKRMKAHGTLNIVGRNVRANPPHEYIYLMAHYKKTARKSELHRVYLYFADVKLHLAANISPNPNP